MWIIEVKIMLYSPALRCCALPLLFVVLGFMTAVPLCAVSISTKDGLALDLSPTGRVTGLRLGDASVPLVGEGGFSLAEYLPVTNPVNLAPNPDFEKGTTSWTMTGDCRIDATLAHSGKASLRLNSRATTAPTFAETVIPVKPNTRYHVELWMHRESVIIAGASCAERDDQGRTTGRTIQVTEPISETEPEYRPWFPLSWEVTTAAQTTRLALRAEITRSTGAVCVDDIVVSEMMPAPYHPVPGTVLPAEGGVTFKGALPDAGLALEATVRGGGDYLRVDGVVSDTTGKDRAVGVKFALPANLRGWRWYDDTEENREISGDNLYRSTYKCKSGIGECSIYPWSAVSGPQGGLSLALPLSQGPRVFLLQHDQQGPELSVTFFLGLSAAAGKNPSRAPFSFLLYRHDPHWGMRSALARYYAFFPESFVKRPDRAAYLNYVNAERFDPTTHRISGLPDASDFGEGYRFLFHMHGYYCMKVMTKTTPGLPTDEEIRAFLPNIEAPSGAPPGGWQPSLELLKKTGYDAYWVPTVDLVKMLPFDEFGHIRLNGPPAVIGSNQPERYNWGLEFSMNYDPDVSSVIRDYCRLVLDEYARDPKRRPWDAMMDNDGIDGCRANIKGLDYRREHFRATLPPLSFGKDHYQVGIVNTIWDFLCKAWWPLTNEYKVVSHGNVNYYEQVFIAPYVDFQMAEYDWDCGDPGRYERYLRAINHTKPWRFVRMPCPPERDFNLQPDPDSVRRSFRRGLAYDIFPAFYSLNPEPYREEYRLYVPAIEEISAAGWEPIPYARATRGVVVERYGSAVAGELHLTLRNYADRAVTTTVRLDRAGLGFPADAQLVAIDILPGTPRCEAIAATGFEVQLIPDDGRAFWIGTREMAAQHGFRLARATVLKLERLFTTEMDAQSRAAWQQALQTAEEGAGSKGDRLLADAERLQEQLVALQQALVTKSPVDLAKLIMRARAEVSLAPVALLGLEQNAERMVTQTPPTLELRNTGRRTLTGLQASVISPWSEVSGQSQATPARSSVAPGARVPLAVAFAVSAAPSRAQAPYVATGADNTPAAPPRALMPYEVVITGKAKTIPFTVAIPIDVMAGQ